MDGWVGGCVQGWGRGGGYLVDGWGRETHCTAVYPTFLKILLPSGVHLEERLTVSQSVLEARQQSTRQKHTVWVFCQWQMRPQAVGRPYHGRSSSGRVVKQPFGVCGISGSNPSRLSFGAAAAAKSQPTRIRTADQKTFIGCLKFDQQLCVSIVLPHCLEPSERKLLTPPPPPHPLKKVISSFRG